MPGNAKVNQPVLKLRVDVMFEGDKVNHKTSFSKTFNVVEDL
jgi:hypothetical protein|tara:strand:- start:224 stop:349 length:126 start_codon:yes stop_codon:yes gene_type:complete